MRGLVGSSVRRMIELSITGKLGREVLQNKSRDNTFLRIVIADLYSLAALRRM